MTRRNDKGGSELFTSDHLGDADVTVPRGTRRKARLTVADPAFGFDPAVVTELLDALGLLDDETIIERP